MFKKFIGKIKLKDEIIIMDQYSNLDQRFSEIDFLKLNIKPDNYKCFIKKRRKGKIKELILSIDNLINDEMFMFNYSIFLDHGVLFLCNKEDFKENKAKYDSIDFAKYIYNKINNKKNKFKFLLNDFNLFLNINKKDICYNVFVKKENNQITGIKIKF
jgi:hypothetical protein